MGLIRTGPILSSELSTPAMVKRAVSRNIVVTAANFTSMFYTTTAISVTDVHVYVTEVISANAQKIDVGIEGNDDLIVSAASVASMATDSTVALALVGGGPVAVTANHAITASVETNAGTGSVIICVEYEEVD